MTGLVWRGMGRGATPYLQWPPYISLPLSEWTVAITQHSHLKTSETLPRVPATAQVIGKRAFKAGGADVRCVEYSRPYPGWDIETPSTIFVECLSGGLHASLSERSKAHPVGVVV